MLKSQNCSAQLCYNINYVSDTIMMATGAEQEEVCTLLLTDIHVDSMLKVAKCMTTS